MKLTFSNNASLETLRGAVRLLRNGVTVSNADGGLHVDDAILNNRFFKVAGRCLRIDYILYPFGDNNECRHTLTVNGQAATDMDKVWDLLMSDAVQGFKFSCAPTRNGKSAEFQSKKGKPYTIVEMTYTITTEPAPTDNAGALQI